MPENSFFFPGSPAARQAALRTLGRDYVSALRRHLGGRGLTFSGNRQHRLHSRVHHRQLQVLGPAYMRYAVEGHDPGKAPPVSALSRWIKGRGLKLNAHAVAKSIARRGTQRQQPGAWKHIVQASVQEVDLQPLADAYRSQVVEHLRHFKKETK